MSERRDERRSVPSAAARKMPGTRERRIRLPLPGFRALMPKETIKARTAQTHAGAPVTIAEMVLTTGP
jgi:hypothetical protein